MTSPPAELSQCSAFGCNSKAVTVNNLFANTADPDMGIKFQFCEDHNAYYQYIITIVNNCLSTIRDTGQWVYALPPPFPQYQKLLADARARRQPQPK